MCRLSYQEALLDAIQTVLPSGFFRIGRCEPTLFGLRNG
jgi:hypothetical protein